MHIGRFVFRKQNPPWERVIHSTKGLDSLEGMRGILSFNLACWGFKSLPTLSIPLQTEQTVNALQTEYALQWLSI